MFNFFTTITNAIEHSTIKKVFGSYKNAALVEGNINLLHKLQDEKLCNSMFIEPEEPLFTLDMLLGEKKKEEPKDRKTTILEWYNSLTVEEKEMLKNAMTK
jgi:hypothetical protein